MMSGNDYGTFLSKNNTPSVSVDSVVRNLRSQFEESLLEHPVVIGNLQVSLSKSITGQGGHRYWFICPSCGSRVAKLYIEDPLIACRYCMQIKYPSSRFKGMVEEQIFNKDV